MLTALAAFALATVVAGALTPLIRHLAHRFDFLDHALSSRKVHGKPIPRLGGVAIVLGFFAPIAVLLFVHSGVGRQFLQQQNRVIGLFVGGGVIALLGLYDDIRGAGAKTKFAVQFGVAGLAYALGYRIDGIANPFGAPLHLGFLGLPFTLLWIVGIINALNLIDGLDGLAGGVALIAVCITFFVAVGRPSPVMMLATAALGGAIVGFLIYNFHPASIFMGDTGSMFLGFVLAVSSIRANEKQSTTVAVIVPILALGLPIADTLLAMARRAARGAPLFAADRGHIHHKLLDMGLSQRKTVLVLYGASLLLGLAALGIGHVSGTAALAYLVAVAFGIGLFLRRLGYMRFERAQELAATRRRNLAVRASIREIGEALREAAQPIEIWTSVKNAAPVLGAASVRLVLADETRADRNARTSFSHGFDQSFPIFQTRHSLRERPADGAIELGWRDGRRQIDRDTEIAVELLCDHVSTAVERLQRAAGPAPLRAVGSRR